MGLDARIAPVPGSGLAEGTALPWAGDATPGVFPVPVPAHLAESAPLPTWGVPLAPLGLLGTMDTPYGWSRALQEQNQELFPIKWGISCVEVALTLHFGCGCLGRRLQLFKARTSPLHCKKQGIKAASILPKCVKIITAAREILSDTGASVLKPF